MKIKLVDDWKRVLGRSIAFWFSVAGIFFLMFPDFFYARFQIDIDPKFVFFMVLGTSVVSLVGRIIKQDGGCLSWWFKMIAVLIFVVLIAFLNSSYAKDCDCDKVYQHEEETLDIATPLIAKWEGLRTEAYKDIVGVPTICYGSTDGVRIGMVKTKSECDELLREDISDHREGWLEYVSDEAYDQYLTPERDAAFTSLAFNVGISAAGKSTATRRLNKGDIEGACEALGWWNKAGGRVVMGLVNRRSEETELCLSA